MADGLPDGHPAGGDPDNPSALRIRHQRAVPACAGTYSTCTRRSRPATAARSSVPTATEKQSAKACLTIVGWVQPTNFSRKKTVGCTHPTRGLSLGRRGRAAVPELDHTVAPGRVQPLIMGGEEDGRDTACDARPATASHVPRWRPRPARRRRSRRWRSAGCRG